MKTKKGKYVSSTYLPDCTPDSHEFQWTPARNFAHRRSNAQHPHTVLSTNSIRPRSIRCHKRISCFFRDFPFTMRKIEFEIQFSIFFDSHLRIHCRRPWPHFFFWRNLKNIYWEFPLFSFFPLIFRNGRTFHADAQWLSDVYPFRWKLSCRHIRSNWRFFLKNDS